MSSLTKGGYPDTEEPAQETYLPAANANGSESESGVAAEDWRIEVERQVSLEMYYSTIRTEMKIQFECFSKLSVCLFCVVF